jgi:hypothetical protein
VNAKNLFLLLVGSPKRKPSTSESLGTYLLDGLKERGHPTEKLKIQGSLKTEEGIQALLDALDRAKTLIVASPLYVDCLPSPVIRMMEILLEHRKEAKTLEEKRVAAIVNCGFPEARHNDTALAICRCFTRKTGMIWSGGLALGGGEALSGRGLTEVGGMARNVIRSLDLTAEALDQDKPIPREAVSLMAKPLVPSRIYTFMGAHSWRRQAKEHGVQKDLRARPYGS